VYEIEEDGPILSEPIGAHEENPTVRTGAEEFDVDRMITDCLSRYDNILPTTDEVSNEDEDDIGFNVSDFHDVGRAKFFEESTIPLYEGCQTKLLVAVLLLFNCFTVFGVTNTAADEILNVISELLPEGNKLPKSHSAGKKFLRHLGLNYNSIHACRNGCCLFRGELAEALTCPKCGQLRYTSPSSTRAVKILRHFPLIPRLLRMYRCTRLAELNKWHTSRKDISGIMESLPDSKAWKHVNALYPEFASEERNIRLGMALDGVNPYSNQSLSHSTWPVILLNYNLPPWLITKRFFLMLVLIIPGKESVTSENIDVYLAPLIEELQQLWHGVNAVDVSHDGENQLFVLRAILMLCIHDYPAYGLVSGQVTKGYRGCVECGPNVTTRRSMSLGKNLYLGHRRYLRRNHPYRRFRRAFDGTEEIRAPPCSLTGRDIVRLAKARERWLNTSNDNRHLGENDPVQETGVKRLSTLYSLPYWQVSVPLGLTPSQLILFTLLLYCVPTE
jgi:hypothetical protein